MNYGRQRIYTDATVITKDNVADEVRKALLVHDSNRADIDTLYGILRGKTAILGKVKEIREEINHKICENRAFEIVSFYTGYIFGEPIQYVRRENPPAGAADDETAKEINSLNGFMSLAGKAAVDARIAKWMLIGGLGYRLELPNKAWTKGGDEAPSKVYALDPRNTFVVYSNSVDETPMMAVHYVEREHGERVFGVYTATAYFEFTEFEANVVEEGHTLGMIPIVEYSADFSRLGVFEVVVDQLNALNELQSNRMDDIVQFVNSFLAVLGGELDEETYKKLNDWKTLCLPEGTDAKYLSASLSQADVQTLKDDIVQAIFEICGVPNRNGNGASTSDNGVAVLLRDGYTAAEARAKNIEENWKESEMLSLRLTLRIIRDTEGTSLRLSDIKPHFTRRNYENIATKSQVLIAMLNNPWVHPEVAYASCGMFPDPESAYLQGKSWKEEQDKKAAAEMEQYVKSLGDDDADAVQQDG